MKIPISILLASVTFLTGCVIAVPMGDNDPDPPAIEKTYRSEQITLQQLQDGGIALGGVVIRQGTTVHRYPDLPSRQTSFDHADQTKFWSFNCEREFAENVSDVILTPFFRFDEFIEDDLLTSIRAEYAHGGNISPALLESVHAAGSGVRYLIMVRVEYDDISRDIDTAWFIPPDNSGGLGKVSGSSYDPTLVNQTQRPTIRRVVGLTMGMFDLESARCVWEAGIVKEANHGVDPATLDDYSGIRTERIATGQVVIVEEEIPNAPTFNSVMNKCLDAIYSDMFKGMNRRSRRLEADDLADAPADDFGVE